MADPRKTPLTEIVSLRDEPLTCDAFRRAMEAELLERMAGLDLADASDEQL